MLYNSFNIAGVSKVELCPIQNNIRKLRFNADEMTQQELAESIGVSRQTVMAIEARKYSPTLELSFKIAREFGMSLEDIFQYVPLDESQK
mgnify:CR=1 FL=1